MSANPIIDLLRVWLPNGRSVSRYDAVGTHIEVLLAPSPAGWIRHLKVVSNGALVFETELPSEAATHLATLLTQEPPDA